jgi:hypothetical protein
MAQPLSSLTLEGVGNGLHAMALAVAGWAQDNPSEDRAKEVTAHWHLYEDSAYQNSGYAQGVVDIWREESEP